MIKHAQLIVTAWDGPLLVGIARCLTDFLYEGMSSHHHCYPLTPHAALLADIAVSKSHQRRGIGNELIRQTRAQLKPTCRILHFAEPEAADYFKHVGFKLHPSAWVFRTGDPEVCG
jgi:GNAT superfamily N-acetyltransferase